MTLTRIDFMGGVVKDETPLASAPAFVSAQWVRLIAPDSKTPPKAQCIGGWLQRSAATYTGLTRSAHSWIDMDGMKRVATAASTGLRIETNGTITDITPPWFEVFIAKGGPTGTQVGRATVTSGSQFIEVIFSVYDADSDTETIIPHGLAVGQSVTIVGAGTVGNVNIDGTRTVLSNSLTDTTFRLQAGVTANASGFRTGFLLRAAYPAAADKVHALDNFGGNLLFLHEDGPLFEWQPAGTYTVALGTASPGTGWNAGGTKTAGTASNYAYDIKATTQAGKTYRVTFTVARTAGSVQVGVNAGLPTPAIINMSSLITQPGTFSFVFQMPPDPSNLVFQADNTFAGSVTSISLALEDKAYRILEAPIRSQSMFVDPHQIVALVGTVQADGRYNPNTIRTSDRANNRSWVPGPSSLATENYLSSGGRALVGKASRVGNLVWTDNAVYSMSFSPQPAGAAFTYNLVGTGFGLAAKNAVVDLGGFAYWLGTSGQFYGTSFDFQGVLPKAIPCSIKRDVSDNLSKANLYKCWAMSMARYGEIWFFLVDNRNGTTEPNRYAVLNIENGLWYDGNLTAGMVRTAGVDSSVTDFPVLVGLSGTTSQLFDHEQGKSANGAALVSSLRTSEFLAGDGDGMMAIQRIAPDVEDQSGDLLMRVYGSGFPREPMSSVGQFTIAPTTVEINCEFLARSMSVEYSASNTNSFWRLGAMRFDLKQLGARR